MPNSLPELLARIAALTTATPARRTSGPARRATVVTPRPSGPAPTVEPWALAPREWVCGTCNVVKPTGSGVLCVCEDPHALTAPAPH